jgi:tetratricopeptide (TPR) repeat protein
VDPEKGFKDSILKAWSNKELQAMDTEEIVKTLKSFNVVFDEEQFKAQANQYNSAIQLSEDHYYTQDFTAEGHDEDFIWVALIELWKRLMPEQCNVEMIDDAIQDGYDLMECKKHAEGLQKWETAWQLIKDFVPHTIASAEKADEFMPVPLTEPFFNWCQDFEMELHNRGLDDTSWLKKRIIYVNEFCERFPYTDSLVLQNMRGAEAQSYALLGDMEKAESLFEVLATSSHNVWAYIAWGDSYWRVKDAPDYEKAEHIYRLGLDHCTDELHEIYERLELIKTLRNKS